MCKCLYCYRPLNEGEKDFHSSCVRKFFGTDALPELPYTCDNLDELASAIIAEKTTLTGVQPKLSLHLTEHEGCKRLTIVGLWGGYIMKPQSAAFAQLPEVEDLTMHLAELFRIAVVPHTLMRMEDGSLCYLTRRVDRSPSGEKIAMEDMCQLTNRQTEHKYRCSYERVGKTIHTYSAVPKMDVTNYLDLLLFCYLSGNNDMHLKNFSLYESHEGEYRLTPAYDLINAAILLPSDTEELALSLNGKRSHLTRADFEELASELGIELSVVDKLIRKYHALQPEAEQLIRTSFLSEEMQTRYIELLRRRLVVLA